MRARVPALLVTGILAVAAPRAGAKILEGSPPPRVTSDAVWSPPDDFVAAMHRACDARSGEAFGACFVEEMRRAGASEAAVAFVRRTGDQGYLKEFRTTGGPVDAGCAVYPFRANENAVCFLVNGAPAILDVDDPRYLDPDALGRTRRTPASSGPTRTSRSSPARARSTTASTHTSCRRAASSSA